MTLDDMLTEVRNILGEEEEDFWDNSELTSHLNEAQLRFCQEARWPWLLSEGTSSLTADDPLMYLETGIAENREFNIMLQKVGDSNRKYQPKRVAPVEGFKLRTLYQVPGSYPVYFYVTQSNDSGANEVQTVTNGGSTSGTFTLTFDGQTTAVIARGASAATIEAALKALSNVGPGDVRVTGGPLGTDAVSVEFQRDLGHTNVPAMTLGGTVTSLTVSTVIVGGSASGLYKTQVRFIPTPVSDMDVEFMFYRAPGALIDGTDVPELPTDYHKAIVHYAAGTAWEKELTQGIQRASEQYQLYTRIVDQAKTEWKGQADDTPLVVGKDEPQYPQAGVVGSWLARIPTTLGP